MMTQAQSKQWLEAAVALASLPIEARLQFMAAQLERIEPIYHAEIRAYSQRVDRMADDMQRRLERAV